MTTDAKESRFYAGLMTGTSMDAIDVVIISANKETIKEIYHSRRRGISCDDEPDASVKLIASSSLPMPDHLRSELEYCIATGTQSSDSHAERPYNTHHPSLFHRLLTARRELTELAGHAYAQCLKSAEQKVGDTLAIEACGCHGQTLFHIPGFASWQLFDSALFAVQNSVRVISNFRDKDIALGGQGAPLAPLFHQFIFGYLGQNACAVNIGGISNISMWRDDLRGWDIGPGNRLMDAWMQQHFNCSFDEDGEIARANQVNANLLSQMLMEPYFSITGAKSTGRELFNLTWLSSHLAALDLENPNQEEAGSILSTLTELTALAIAKTLSEHDLNEAVLCGGGAKNTYLRERILSNSNNTAIRTSNSIGYDGQLIEGMAFAFFACLRDLQLPAAIASVTGATKDSVCGSVFEP